MSFHVKKKGRVRGASEQGLSQPAKAVLGTGIQGPSLPCLAHDICFADPEQKPDNVALEA